MNKEEVLKQIAEELESVAIYDEYRNQVSALDSKEVRIGVLGQSNTGKTTFINALLGTDIPTSNLPSGINYVIAYGQENSETKDESGSTQTMSIRNEWLEKNNVVIREINANIVLEEITQVELCKLLSNCDVCVYLMNAQSALNRTDMFVIQNLYDVNIPTLLVLSRTDFIDDEDYSQVLEFIRGNLQKYSGIEILDRKKPLVAKGVAEDLQASVLALLIKADVAVSRANFENFYLGNALSQLFGKCQEKIEACLAKQEDIRKLAEGKQDKLNEKVSDWLKVETELRRRFSDLSDKLRSLMEGRKDDVIRRLEHDVDVCGDIKLFWEKDFPFRLEEMMKVEVQSASQEVNRELIKIMQWLQDDLLRQFGCRISLTTGIVDDKRRDPMLSASDVEVADTNKLKIVTRIGTVATVIAAGALFSTMGIGGIVMAVSMASGLGAEFLMRKKTNDSREQIKKNLPEIVSRAQLQIITDFNQKIQDVTDELISHLQELKAEWQEKSIKAIEQEKTIAVFNFNPARWENVMSRINQLSEIVLK